MLRRQRLAVLAACVGLCLVLRLAPTDAASAFDNVVIGVDPAVFSPNGDSRKDRVDISYTLPDSARVKVTVHKRDSVAVVVTLKDSSHVDPPVRFVLPWGGTYTGGAPAPDGDYTIVLSGTTVHGVPLEGSRDVRLDTRVPVIQSFTITPRVDTTRVAASPNVVFNTQVGNAEIGDSLFIAVRSGQNRPQDREVVEHLQLLLGAGTYPAECDSCFDKAKFPDGKHRVRVRVADHAGNVATVIDSLDHDVLGPKPAVSHPPLSEGFIVVAHADSLVGSTSDRHGVSRIELHVGAPLDTTILLPQSTTGSLPLHFVTPLAFLGDAEGSYPMVVRARDPYGVADSLSFTYQVDRTPPPIPRLSPRPGPITQSSELLVTLAVDAAQTTGILRSGGANPTDTTSVNAANVTLSVILAPNRNFMTFRGLDRVGNISAPETLTVTYATTFGLFVPERFHAGQVIQVGTGNTPGAGVEVRIFATDGSTVRRFEDLSSKNLYSFPWDLKTPDGYVVKNGAYLVRADFRLSTGKTERQQKLIAVLE